MKVYELITLLEKMPKTARVVFPHWNYSCYEDVTEIKKTRLYDSPSRGIIEPCEKNEKAKSFLAVIMWEM